MTAHVDPTRASGQTFVRRNIEGPVVMLNLLRFRDVADYSASPNLAPDAPISGEDAYRRYIAHATPHIEAAGASLMFMGRGGPNLIGPDDERWDLVLLVRHASTEAFLAFAKNEAYLAGIGHRTAALADSRLLPIEQDAF